MVGEDILQGIENVDSEIVAAVEVVECVAVLAGGAEIMFVAGEWF